jgi:hypothetical protein
VLLKLLPEKSLDYKDAHLDLSFFPHETFTGVEWVFRYRPAVVRKVALSKRDAIFFNVEVYPLARRCSGFQGLSTQRSQSLRPLETLIECATGTQVSCDQLFVYRPCLLNSIKIEYDRARLP